VFGRIDDAGPQLIGETWVRKLPIVAGQPQTEVVRALLLEGGKKRVGDGSEILLALAEQVSAEERKRLSGDEGGSHRCAARGRPRRDGRELRNEASAGVAQYVQNVLGRSLFNDQIISGQELGIALVSPSHAGGPSR